MELNKHYNCFKFDTLDVVRDLKYDKRRELDKNL